MKHIKQLLGLLAIVILASCSGMKSTASVDGKTVYWSGNNCVLTITDTTGATYEPVRLKHASRRKLRKIELEQERRDEEARIFFEQQ